MTTPLEAVEAYADQIKQLICRAGHVTEIAMYIAPGVPLSGHIQACPKCGARADWRRSRPKATVVRNQFNPLQR